MMTSSRDALVLPHCHTLFDDRRLQVELHPRRDRRADQANHHRQVAIVAEADAGRLSDRRERRRFPVRVREHAGDDIRQVEQRSGQEDLFDAAVRAMDDDRPYDEGAQRHDDVLRDAEEFQAAGDTGKLGHHVAEIRDDERQHQPERHAESELLANEIAQALAGDRTHPGGHLLNDHQGDGDRDHRPEERIAELRASHRVCRDTAGIVVDVRRDEPGADDREYERQPAAPALAEQAFHVTPSDAAS